MAKIILKWRYLKPGAKAHNENLVKYIAKREGVEKIDDSWKAEPVSKAQQKMIDELLQEFPESKDSYEYQDFLRQPNKGNASEFITRTIEENLDQVDKRENYVQYIAKRPRVEKVGTHGLFTDDNVPVHLNEVAEEVASHQGVLMTQILSLRREDAARLGYEKGEAWRTLIRNHTKDMAEAMNIPMEDLRWYAAFHNESHHPHCHIIAYSIGKEPYITQERLLKLKSAFGSEMFRNERMQAFQEQTKYRDQLAEETRQLVSRIVDEINTGVYHDLLQAYSRTNRVEKETKPWGIIVCYRNLKQKTDDALALFSKGQADGVLTKDFEFYAQKFNELVTKIKELAPTPASIDMLYSEDDQKEFVLLFRELTRYLLSLQTFVEFRFDRSNLDMSDQEYQDYKSKYLMLYRKHQTGKEVISVLDDVDFCIELMESDRINVAYIMNLIRNINFQSKQTRDKDIEHIKDELDRSDNMRLHKKIDILRAFLDQVVSGFDGSEDIDAAYNDFENKQKSEEIEAFAAQEDIDPAMLRDEVAEFEFTGVLNPGEIRDRITKPLPLLKKKSLVSRIVEFIRSHVDKYSRLCDLTKQNE